MIGQRIGNYRITDLIGRGGMGQVYAARHEQLGRRAAIKVLLPSFASQPEIGRRFFNEARAVNLIDDPGLVEIHEYGQLPDGAPYLIMEHLSGETIGQRLRRQGALAPGEVVRLARQLAATLQVAHAAGVIHRDLKPENVFIIPDREAPGGERTKLLDFGIAKIAEGSGTLTQSLLGTPRYMSPEQCRGAGHVTAQSDVYSLGIMLYEALCGAAPFAGHATGEVIVSHITQAPAPLGERQPGLDPELCALVMDMLRKEPPQRPTTAQVHARLRALEARLSAPPSPPIPMIAAAAPPAGTLTGASGHQAAALRGGRSRWPIVVLLVLAGVGAVAIARLAPQTHPSAPPTSALTPELPPPSAPLRSEPAPDLRPPSEPAPDLSPPPAPAATNGPAPAQDRPAQAEPRTTSDRPRRHGAGRKSNPGKMENENVPIFAP